MSQETPQGLVVTTALEGLVFVYLEPGPVSEADLNVYMMSLDFRAHY
jgi:hypothetical protein